MKKWIDFITNSNSLLVNNEKEFEKFKEFLNKLDLIDELKGYNHFYEWQKLAKINDYDDEYIIFEFQPNKGLTFGYTIDSSKKWFGLEPMNVDDFDSFLNPGLYKKIKKSLETEMDENAKEEFEL